MAFHIHKDVSWQAGPSTPAKYAFALDVDVDVVDFTNQVATISVIGTATVTDHPNNSRNSFAASDFAVLVPGNVDTTAHPFVYGTYYYQQALPFLPDPQNGDAAKMLVQFRGDTWRNDPVSSLNKVSLWLQGSGLVVDKMSQESSNQFAINMTFNIPIHSTGDTPILIWDSSGCGSSTDYSWQDRQVWASWFDLEWTATLHFNANGGSNAPADATTRGAGDTLVVTIPNGAPTRTNYRFEGWGTSASDVDPTYHAGDTITVSRDDPTVTLYAVWRKYYHPGKIWNGSDWLSHDREPGGDARVKGASAWVDMRTIDAPTGQNDPPSIYHDNDWYNMRDIGTH